MPIKSRLNYDQAPNHGQSLDQGIAFRDKIFRGIVEDLEDLAATGGGDVYGPASAVDERIAVYNGTTGKLIKDGGQTIADLAIGVILDMYPDALTVDAATTAALSGVWTYNNLGGVGDTLTKTTNGAFQTVDGHASAVNNTYLLKNQVNQITNGVWELTTQGTAGTASVLTRTTNSDQTGDFDPQIVVPANGSTNQRKIFNQVTINPTVGTSNIVYSQTTTPALVISKTVAQMQALVAAATLVPGQMYRITNAAAAQGTCSLLVRAYNSTTLEKTGRGSFKNAAMAASVMAEIDYDLTGDVISRIKTFYRDPVYPVEIINGGNNPLTTWLFDSDNISNVRAVNPIVVDITSPATIINCDFGDNCSFDLKNSSMIVDTRAQSNVGFSLGATSASLVQACTIGDSCLITLLDGAAITQCYIGSGKSIDTTAFTTGYGQSFKSYFGNYSDFSVDVTENTACVEAAGVLDMTTFPFCGIIHLDAPGTGTLATITGFPLDHAFELRADIMATSNLLVDNAAGNIFLSGGADQTLKLNSNDFLTLRASERSPTDVIQTGGIIF